MRAEKRSFEEQVFDQRRHAEDEHQDHENPDQAHAPQPPIMLFIMSCIMAEPPSAAVVERRVSLPQRRGSFVEEGRDPRTRDVSGVQAVDAKAGIGQKVVDPAIEVTSARNAMP
jgi:hypothetical protein